MPQELLLSLLQQLRQLLQAPAAAAPAAASTTAGTSGLRAGAALALALAGLPLAAAGTSEGTEPARLLLPALPDAAGAAAETATLLADKDPKIAKKAAAALGYLCWAHAAAPVAATAPAGSPPGGDVDKEAADATASAAADSSSSAGGSAVGSLLEPSVSALLALRTSKNEEVLFAAGEALCFCFGGKHFLLLLLVMGLAARSVSLTAAACALCHLVVLQACKSLLTTSCILLSPRWQQPGNSNNSQGRGGRHKIKPSPQLWRWREMARPRAVTRQAPVWRWRPRSSRFWAL